MKNASDSAFQPCNRFGRGRPKGSRNKATIAFQEMLDGHGESITRRCAMLALKGDPTALRLCMERLIPPRKEHPVIFKLPAVTTSAEVAAALGAVLQGVARGQLTPAEGQMIAVILEGRRKAIQTEEYEARIRALESGSGATHDGRVISLEDPQVVSIANEGETDAQCRKPIAEAGIESNPA
jgi:hypothetical protein